MTQSRRGSFIEAWTNIFIGYWINFVGQILIFPLFGFHATISDNLGIGALFTLVSWLRSYCIRRWFNAGKVKWFR